MPQPNPPVSVAERVDAACDRFEADWRAGKNPRVADYVAAAPESDREALRTALLAVEAELRGDAAENTSGSPTVARTASHTRPKAAAPLAPDPVPKRIDRFEIRGVLGAGAFGRVYRAFDPHLGRDVAIKVPLAGSLNSDAERERFLKEARTAATLRHTNVCPVYEVGEDAGTPFIVMACINGQSLAAVLKGRKEPLPGKQVALVARKLAVGLDAAHKRGIIHRDLKPANVMFDAERKEIVITDFGLARGPQGDAATASAAGGSGVDVTRTGALLGTPAYMSPEQARGDIRAVGPQSDTFALGVILYELLTGKRPFTGTVAEVLKKIVGVDPESPSRLRPDVDPRLEAICLRAMAKDPAARYGTMKELARELDAYLRGTTGPADSTRPADPRPDAAAASGSDGQKLAEVFTGPPGMLPRRLWWRRAVAAVGVLVLGVAVLIAALRRPEPPADPGPAAGPQPPESPSPAPPEPEPWTPLFNGKDLTGWTWHHGYTHQWRIEDGVLIGYGTSERLVLQRVEKFTDFALRVEYQLDPGRQSAVLLWPAVGRAVNIILGGPSPAGVEPPRGNESVLLGTGSLRFIRGEVASLDLMSCHTPAPERPPGEWNLMEITSAGGVLVVTVNGVEVNRKNAKDLPAFRDQVGRALTLGVGLEPDAGVRFRTIAVRKVTGPPPREPVSPPPGAWTRVLRTQRQVARWKSGEPVRLTQAGVELTQPGGIEIPVTGSDVAVRAKVKKLGGEDIRLTVRGHDGKGPTAIFDVPAGARMRTREEPVNPNTPPIPAPPPDPEGFTDVALVAVGNRVVLFFNGVPAGQVTDDRAVRAGTVSIQVTGQPFDTGRWLVQDLRVCVLDGTGLTPEAALRSDTPDWSAADWVVGAGGTVTVSVGGNELSVGPSGSLPAGPVTLTRVSLLGTSATDADLDRLKNLGGLRHVALDGGWVTDAGLARLAGLPLVSLDVAGPNVTDAGMGHVAAMTGLTALNLSWSEVGDGGLDRLAPLTRLTHLNLTGTRVTDAGAAGLARFKQLRELRLDGTRVTDAALVSLPTLPELERLSLADTGVTDDGVKVLARVRTLRTLELEGTKVTLAAVEELRKALPGCSITTSPPDPDRATAERVLGLGGRLILQVGDNPNVTVAKGNPLPPGPFRIRLLDLSRCAGVTDDVLAGLRVRELPEVVFMILNETAVTDAGLAYLRGAVRLEGVHLEGTGITGSGLVHLAVLPDLRSLVLHGCRRIDDESLRHVRGLTRLKLLAFAWTRVTDAGLSHLRTLTDLEQLHFAGAAVTGRGLADLKGLTRLRGIDARFTPADDAGLAASAALPALAELNLEGAGRITDGGLAVLRSHPTLRVLLLRSTSISDDAIPHLATLTGLTQLDLTDSRVTEAGRQKLREALPNCKVLPEPKPVPDPKAGAGPKSDTVPRNWFPGGAGIAACRGSSGRKECLPHPAVFTREPYDTRADRILGASVGWQPAPAIYGV
jgi:serine/threonine protein kinase